MWHHYLHPSVEKSNAYNSFPHSERHPIHPTHVTLRREGHGELSWSSRHHRKQRYKVVSPSQHNRAGKTFFQRLGNMTHFEVWNISWWVAISFTLGSIIWVINGFYSFLPSVTPRFAKSDSGLGWTAWVGATIFELGSVLGVLEAWNRDDVADFGRNVEQTLPKSFTSIKKSASDPDPLNGALKPHWIWFSGDKKFFRELGFLAAFFQLCGATVFWISGWTGIPNIQSAISEHTGVLDGIYWTPQVVGGFGFITSSILLMLEVQKKWYKPDPLSLGWHVGFWNFVGAIGFTLCGALGYAAEASTKANYQSTLSTFWGGWAFLIGSVIQWYEAVNSIK